MIPAAAAANGVVVFAGAGVSMVPPSSLPNWYGFNDTVLRALADRVASYARPEVGEWIFKGLLERRKSAPHFAPDFMADVIAEEIGFDYFGVVQALDSDLPNASHLAVAALAKAGIVRAVVTTNFDRLFERAFDQVGCAYRRHATYDEFNELAADGDSGPDGPVPVIKVHGTIEDVESMVDTLSQRLVGRPHALESALGRLYRRHHVLFLGFSGADLDYDDNYLGLTAAAGANAGFTYLNRTDTPVRLSIERLREAWGDGATVVDGQLPDAVVDLARTLGVEVPASGQPSDGDPLERIRQRADEWSAAMSRMQNVNILSSLLRAGGEDPMTGRLFWGVWRRYRQAEDCEGPAYARLNHLIGRYLLDYGFSIASLRPPDSIVVASWGDAPFDKDEMDNAYQFLARASHLGDSSALVELAKCQALLGKCRESLELISKVLNTAVENRHSVFFVDAAIAGGTVWSLAGVWSDGLKCLDTAHGIVQKLGFEPRRAQLCAHLVRFLAWQNRYDEAAARYQEGGRIADRLGMDGVRHELDAAFGYSLFRQQKPGAVPLLANACDFFERTGRLSLLTRAALDLFWAGATIGEQAAFERGRDLLQEFERGYAPHVYAAQCEVGMHFEEFDYARANLESLEAAAAECENGWAANVAKALAEELERRQQNPAI